MKIWTYGEILNQVEMELDLQEETFIQPAELLSFYNQAIEDAEAEIHGIYEDYFLTHYSVPLVSGTADYALPANIYANKIRRLVFNDGTRIYAIPQIRGEQEFESISLMQQYAPGINNYGYILRNDSAISGIVLQLVPASQVTSSTAATLWYLRDAQRAALTTDACDIPEFANFLIAHMKRSCLSKEYKGEPPEYIVNELERQRKLMVDTLTARVPDADTRIALDLSFYDELS